MLTKQLPGPERCLATELSLTSRLVRVSTSVIPLDFLEVFVVDFFQVQNFLGSTAHPIFDHQI